MEIDNHNRKITEEQNNIPDRINLSNAETITEAKQSII